MTLKRPRRCAYRDCGPVAGQMLVCAAHWSVLSEELRGLLLATWDEMDGQDRATGYVKIPLREQWRTLTERALAELAACHAILEQDEGRRLSASGREWVRVRRHQLERAKAALEVES